jgi:hypothetical protein
MMADGSFYNISLVLCSLIRTSHLGEGTSAKKEQRKMNFPLVLCSLIRTFDPNKS